MALNITTLHAECRFFNVMLSVIMLSSIMLSVIMPNGVLLSVVATYTRKQDLLTSQFFTTYFGSFYVYLKSEQSLMGNVSPSTKLGCHLKFYKVKFDCFLSLVKHIIFL
jgi:hypothetical protein